MTSAEWGALIAGSVLAPLLVAVLLAVGRSLVRALGSVPQLVEQVRDLAEQVRELAEAATDVRVLRAELIAHTTQADERWATLGGIVPHPRYAYGVDRRPRSSTERRRVIDTVGEVSE